MAEIATKLLQPITEEIGKGILAPIKRQLNYLCCFKNNIQTLRDESQTMEDARDALLMQVLEAENNAHEIFPSVRTWLTDTSNMQVRMAEIETHIQHVESGCLRNISSYSISKKSVEMAEAMMELRKSRELLDPISHPIAPASMVPVPLRQIHEFQSRKQIEEDVVNALQHTEVTVVGIAGIGGVGKTTMAEKIMYRMMTEKLVDEAIKVVVSQQVDMLKIQLEIAELLGFKELKNWETLQGRAHQLHARLTGSKKILIVFDDVWEKLKLENIGIPCKSGSGGCTVLLTSRNVQALNQMNAQVFTMQILPKLEAWTLFIDKVGTCVNDPNLMFVAEQVVKECKGLPIAIQTVGSALKDQEKGIWEDALDQLRSSNPTNMPEVLEEVYNPLYLSYKFLKSQIAKSLFLLCSLFPEDFDISIEDLTLYGLGLSKFDGVQTLGRVRNRVLTSIAMLKNHSLLLDGKDKHHVRIHDVIRDVAIFIAAEQGLVEVEFSSRKHSYTKCEWITVFPKSSDHSFDHLTGLQFMNLRLLIIQKRFEFWKALETNGIHFIKGMKELKVLCFENISFQLPDRIGFLKNLCILNLVDCTLETISTVSELSCLEILICYRCRNIREIPHEIGRLKCLKLLNVSSCDRLKRIAPRVIQNFVELEELKILDSFDGWESAKLQEKERKNASLMELESLTKLSCLEIQIGNANLAEEEIRLSPTITKYKILIGTENYGIYDKVLALNGLPRDSHVGKWIHVLGRTIEGLSLNGDGSRNIEISYASNMIKSLEVENCQMLEVLVNKSKISGSIVFPALEHLKLSHLPNFKEICDNQVLDTPIYFQSLKELSLKDLPSLAYMWKCLNQNAWFYNLTKIFIRECHKLRSVFLMDKVGDVLIHLQLIVISNCENMKEVFCNKEDEKGSHIAFPKLKELRLHKLPSLEAFAKGIESIEFPLLTRLHYIRPHNHHTISSHLFNNEKVKFDGLEVMDISTDINARYIWCKQTPQPFFKSLKSLTIRFCSSIRSSFPSSVAHMLVSLQGLSILRCKNMEKVIWDEDNVSEKSLSFPSLQELFLWHLPKLKMFYKSRCALQFPLLKQIHITRCPQMELFSSISPSTPNLKNVQVDDHKVIKGEVLDEIEDLNGLIRQHIVSTKMDSSSDEEVIHGDQKLVKIVQEDQEIIYLDTGGSINMDLSQIHNNAEALKIRGCEMLKQLVITSTTNVDLRGLGVYPVLKYLTLHDLPNLTEICDTPIPEGSNSFKNLRKLNFTRLPSMTRLWMTPENISISNLCEVTIFDCPELTSLFSLICSKDVVLQLRLIDIYGCKKITQIFPVKAIEKDAKPVHMKFPVLKEMKLSNLQSLVTLGEGIESIEFPMLEILTIISCPKLVSIASHVESKWRDGDENNHDDESLRLFCNQKVQFTGLKQLCLEGYKYVSNIWCRQIPMCFFTRLEELRIHDFNSISDLFSSSIAENLVNLEHLAVRRCKCVEIVVSCGKEKHENSKLFQQLKTLILYGLPLLGIFADLRCALELPSLTELWIRRCPLLESLTPESLSIPKLEHLYLDSEELEMEQLKNIHDFNDFLRQHVLSTRMGWQ